MAASPLPRRTTLALVGALAFAPLGCQEPVPDPGSLPPSSLKRLRSFEYTNTIRDLFRGRAEVATALPEDLVRANFTSISATQDCNSDVDIETYETIALEVAAEAFSNSPTPLDDFGCVPSSIEDECVVEFIAEFGLRAWRRPLDDAQVARYAVLAANMAALYDDDPIKGVELAVAGLLQSPYFLYRIELGRPVDEGSETRKYSSYEMASRLSYTLWETMPDDELLDLADRGKLRKRRQIEKQAERMLDDPPADAALSRFWREHLDIDRLTLDNYPKPGADASLYAAMRAESEAMVDELITPGTDALGFLTMTLDPSPELAAHYGEGPRQGYLSSGVFLTTNSHPNKNSPTHRGKFVLERILCQTVPPPPPDVDLSLPEPEGEIVTLRDSLEAHRADPSCSGCHALMDPQGYAFEHYGPLGEYRELDNGAPIDATGEFRGSTFDGAIEFIENLSREADVTRCLSVQAYRNAIGQLESEGQEINIDQITNVFFEEGRDIRGLMFELVTSDAFRYAHRFVGDED